MKIEIPIDQEQNAIHDIYYTDPDRNSPDIVDLDTEKQMETPPGVPNGAQYLGPDEEAPEGSSTYEGPQGATYYVPPGSDNPDRAEIEDFGGLTETSDPQTPDIDADKGDRKEFLGYMSSGHEQINDALRGDEEMTDDIRRHIDVVGSYIEEAPDFEEPAEVYRGLTASPDLADQLRQAEGQEIEMGGFQSTSTNPEVANRFTDYGDEGDIPVMMNIETESGLPIDNTNLESGTGGEEQEVLLGHNWTYQVQNVEETGDGLLVDMEVVSDD